MVTASVWDAIQSGAAHAESTGFYNAMRESRLRQTGVYLKNKGKEMAKRTLQNCTVIKRALVNGKKWPHQQAGKCKGYSNIKGRIIPKCMDCKLRQEKKKNGK